MPAANSLSPFDRVPSPCVGICSTGLGDEVCRGCKRFNHEVIQWNSLTETQKRVVDQRLEDFLQQVFAVYLRVIDEPLLRSKVAEHKVRVAAHRNAAGHGYELLRAGGNQIDPLADFGLEATVAGKDMSPAAMKQAIDTDFWQLSSAHYERYFRQ